MTGAVLAVVVALAALVLLVAAILFVRDVRRVRDLEPVSTSVLGFDSPRAGTIGVTPSRGWVAAVIRVVTRCPQAAHAFIATGYHDEIIEGDPHGARYGHARSYDSVVWLTGLAADLTDSQRLAIVKWAKGHIGTPYSWLDDLEIGLVDVFGWAPLFLRRRLRSDRTLMCSQLCDSAYHAAGVDLFADGRPAGGVSPADLYRLDERVRAAAGASVG